MLGFSQGAGIVHLILSMHKMGKINWEWLDRIQFCVLVCGFSLSWDVLNPVKCDPIEVPSVHLISEVDFVYHKSVLTSCQFSSPLVIEHPFGHSFPRMGKIESRMIKKYIEQAAKTGKGQVPATMSSL